MVPFLANRRLCCSLAASICIFTLSPESCLSCPSDTTSHSEPPLLIGLLRFSTLCCQEVMIHQLMIHINISNNKTDFKALIHKLIIFRRQEHSSQIMRSIFNDSIGNLRPLTQLPSIRKLVFYLKEKFPTLFKYSIMCCELSPHCLRDW